MGIDSQQLVIAPINKIRSGFNERDAALDELKKRVDLNQAFTILQNQFNKADAMDELGDIAEVMLRLDSERAIDTVLPLLHHPDETLRWYICGLLSQFGNTECVEPIIILLQDPSPDVRHVAAFALQKIGDERALPQLQDVVENDHSYGSQGHSVNEMAADAIITITSRLIARRINGSRNQAGTNHTPYPSNATQPKR